MSGKNYFGRRQWSQEEDAYLLRRKKAGAPYAQIATEMGLPRVAQVANRYRKLTVPSNNIQKLGYQSSDLATALLPAAHQAQISQRLTPSTTSAEEAMPPAGVGAIQWRKGTYWQHTPTDDWPAGITGRLVHRSTVAEDFDPSD